MMSSMSSSANSRPMLRLHNMTLAYGDVNVLNEVNLVLEAGEIGCVLGPSGCGKTTLLQSIAGFHTQLSGEIYLDDVCIASEKAYLSPDKREVGMVFQDFALFPHMSVLENVEYGLHRLSAQERQTVALDIIDKVGMSDFTQAYPHQLSGGQQQRVAIARAVAPKPRLLLLDEPFSSLDPALREKVAVELRDIIKRLGISALLVTHDQQEAFAFADKIGIFAQGYCQQWSSPYTLYHKPNTAFVANFIGESTFISGEIVSGASAGAATATTADKNAMYVKSQLGLHVLDQHRVSTDEETSLQSTLANNSNERRIGDKVQLLVRPDDIVHQDNSPFKAKVIDRRFRGAHILYRLALPESAEQVLCLAPSHHDHQIGEHFGITLSIEHVICFSS